MSDIYKDYGILKVLIDNESGQSLYDFDIDFVYMNVIYEPSSIPSVYLSVECDDGFPQEFYDLENIIVKIKYMTNMVSFKIGIDKMKTDKPKTLELFGYLCKSNNFNDIKTKYLGSSLKDAVQALEIRDDSKGIETVSQDYWQIQETDTHALLRLLRQSAQNSIFTLTDDKIVVINLDEKREVKKKVMPSRIEYFARNKKVKLLKESTTNIVESTYVGGQNIIITSEVRGSKRIIKQDSRCSLYTSFGKMYIDETKHLTSLLNKSTSLPYSILPMDTLAKFRYDKIIFPYDIGDIMEIDFMSTYKGTSLLILDKIYEFSPLNVSTSVLFAGNSLSEE